MIRGRIEATPAEQLEALRKARDHYKALADGLQDNVDTAGGPEEKSRAEQDARRIANAYEKTIANILASSRIREIPQDASRAGRLWAGLMVLSLLIFLAIAAFLILGRGAERANTGAGAANMAAAVPDAENKNSTQAPARGSIKTDAPIATPTAPPAINPRQRPLAVRAVDLKGRARHRPNTIRHPAGDASPPADSGFVVKVLQPDGSLRDEVFPPSTSLR